MKRNSLEWLVVIFTVIFIAVGGIKLHKKYLANQIKQRINDEFSAPSIPIPEKPAKPKFPQSPTISNKIPAYLEYAGVVAQLKEWNIQAKDLTEIGTYGQSSKGTDLYYIRINNKFDLKPKPKVLITACIHGNEPHSTGCVMGYAGIILAEYGKNQEITDLVNSRDIYIIPIISPDSYPHSRDVNGVDPNRNFPGPNNPNKESVPPIKAVQDFFLKIKPNAVISGHTFGRVFLTPFGDKNDFCLDHTEYQRIVGQMGEICQYKIKRACEVYGRPIYGTEIDWYYLNNAFKTLPNGKTIHSGAFSVVMEFGTHQRIPTHKEIVDEFNMTWKAFLYFLQEAPKVEIWWDESGRSVNPDGSLKTSWLRAA